MNRSRNTLSALLLVGALLALPLVPTASASRPIPDWPAHKCAQARVDLVAKALKSQLRCISKALRKAEKTDDSCLQRARTKLAALWEKNDLRSSCSSEAVGLVRNVHDVLDDLLTELTNNPQLGAVPQPRDDSLTNPARLVFLAPFCTWGPNDFDSEEEYRAARIEAGCFPNLPDDLLRWPEDPIEPLIAPDAPFDADRPVAHLGEYCREIAAANGLVDSTSRFDVWASTATTWPAKRFTHAAGDYVLPSGTIIAEGWNDLVDGSLGHPIDENIEGRRTHRVVGTGTRSDGTPASHCDSWRDLNGQVTYGWSTARGASWSESPSTAPCWLARTLYRTQGVYCFQQEGPAPMLGE